ncbi:PD40 domain-containing protein [Akkermansiaceae bacterium]|nr:PD40 domain-containing protein [Akkermansiaceae bacterium]
MAFLLTAFSAGRTAVNAMAWPALSPDGGTLAFEWLDDIWLAPSAGGEAVRLTTDPARDSYPKFTPDGKRVVFTSERSGSQQIHSVKTDGSDARRHSANTEGCMLNDISPDGTFAIARGERESSGYRPFRLLRISLLEPTRETMLFDATAHSAAVSGDGMRYLFCRGGEQPFRYGYRGARASQIHLFDAKDGSFRELVAGDWEARTPLWHPDGKGFYYLSNETGTFNIRFFEPGGGASRQITFFKEDSVVNPALSADGKTMVFRAGKGVYRFFPESGKAPEEIDLFATEKLPSRFIRKLKVSGTSSTAFARDGKSVVFSSAGDLWTMSAGAEQAVRLTETDASDERDPLLSRDGSTLFFLRDDGLRAEVCSASLAMDVITVLSSSERSKRSLRLSPDGSMLSWIEATGDLVTLPVAGGEEKTVMPCWDSPTYDWSPDGKWLVVAAKDIHSNRDIWIVPADGSEQAHNLTAHPAFDGSPRWSPDGSRIVILSRRDADEMARMWVFDAAGKLIKGEADFATLADSLRPVDTDVSEPTRLVWAPDSRSVLFQSRDTADKTVYAQPIGGGEVREYADFRGIPAGIADNGAMFWRLDRVPTVCFGRVREAEFRFGLSVSQDRGALMRLGFRRIWRTISERFYDEAMNGRDWPAMLARYEDAAAASRNSRQFDRVVGELLGELNASHLTFLTKPWGVKSVPESPRKPTAHPGILFSQSLEGRLVVAGTVPGSPISRLDYPPRAGESILRIGGKAVDARSPLEGFFNGAEGVSLPIVVADEAGAERAMELVPVSYGEIRSLDRAAKILAAEEAAGKQGITYLPFRRMKSEDLRELAVEVYRASLVSEGLILDLRDNAGGRVADELLGIFCQPAHTFTVPRGGPRGYPVDRRISPSWDGPMVVLCNGNTFSNAEIFCHAFKRLGRGTLVGQPTNGGVISAVPVSIPDMGELQVPFRGWFDSKSGRDLELNGAVPDVLVPLGPDDQAAGRDTQLSAAISVLSKDIAGRPAPVDAKIKRSGE